MSELEQVGCLFGHSAEPVLLFERGDWWLEQPGSFGWQRCPDCGLQFLSPRPTAAVIGGYYPAHYAAYRGAIDDEKWGLMRWKRRRNLRPLVDAVAGRVEQPGRLLDVGCATGNYLAEMRRRGWQVQGVELNEEAAAYARARFGLEVVSGDLLKAALPPASFDVVTLWDVLEHTHHPLEILREVHRLLQPGGLLVFSVPDPDSAGARRFGPCWIGYDTPRHLYLFGGQSLRLLLENSGFRLLESDYFLGTYHTWVASFQTWLHRHIRPGPLRQLLTQLATLPLWSVTTAPYFHWLNRRRQGSVLTVYARKS